MANNPNPYRSLKIGPDGTFKRFPGHIPSPHVLHSLILNLLRLHYHISNQHSPPVLSQFIHSSSLELENGFKL